MSLDSGIELGARPEVAVEAGLPAALTPALSCRGRHIAGDYKDDTCRSLLVGQGQDLVALSHDIPWGKRLDPLALKGPQLVLLPGDDVSSLLAAGGAQVLRPLVAIGFDQPQAQALKVAG